MKLNFTYPGTVLRLCAVAASMLATPGIFFGQPLTLEEAVETARRRNLALLQQMEMIEIAELDKDIQTAARLPTLDFSLQSSYTSEVNVIDLSQRLGIPDATVRLGGHDRTDLALSVNQPIFTGFLLKLKQRLAGTKTLSEKARLDLVEDEALHAVHLVFYQSQSLYLQRKVLLASVRRLDVQLQQMRNLLAAAQAMAFDTLQVANQKLAIEIEKENVALDLRLADLQMARLLDLQKIRPIVELTPTLPDTVVGDEATLLADALEKRPELADLRFAQQGADIQSKMAQAPYYPSVIGRATYHVGKPGLDPVNNEWMDYYSVGVGLQWNLWRSGADKKRVQQAEARARQLALQEREVLRVVELEVTEGLDRLQSSLRELRLANELEQQQAERFRIVSAQYRNSLATVNDVVTAEIDLTAAQLRTQQALIKYHVALTGLRKATGTIGGDL